MKVFLSFATEDIDFVLRLTKHLSNNAIEPISIDLRITYQGIVNPSLLKEKLKIDGALVIVSKHQLSNRWLQKEKIAFLGLEDDPTSRFVYCVIVDESKPPLDIEEYIDANFYQKLDEESFKEEANNLVRKLKGRGRRAIVVMPFKNETLRSAYRRVYKPKLTEAGYSVVRLDETRESRQAVDQLHSEIAKSALVVGELTGERPNVYYEIGYAQGLGKEVILCAMAGTDVHFDLYPFHRIIWSTEEDLQNQLDEWLKGQRKKNGI